MATKAMNLRKNVKFLQVKITHLNNSYVHKDEYEFIITFRIYHV